MKRDAGQRMEVRKCVISNDNYGNDTEVEAERHIGSDERSSLYEYME